MNTQPFSCKRDNLTIRGVAMMPEGPWPFPAVILCHGFMGDARSMFPYAEALASMGYAAFAFDFCGGGLHSSSDGATTQMSVLTEKQDLLAVMDAVLAREDVDPARLYLLGGSQGGLVSALAAAERNAQVAALIMLYPALCIPDHARRGALMMASYDPISPPDIIHCGPMPVGRCYHDAVVNMDPFAIICDYTGPVLILHGTADRVVPIEYAYCAGQAYGEARCQLIPIVGADHGYTEDENRTVLACIRLFLRGMREQLRISVRCLDARTLVPGENGRVAIRFHAACDHALFKGETQEPGIDTQDLKDGVPVRLHAEYTLQGRDPAGEPCALSIVNTEKDGEWKPTIQTDSRALSFLNTADLTAVMEFLPEGPVVHIFCMP